MVINDQAKKWFVSQDDNKETSLHCTSTFQPTHLETKLCLAVENENSMHLSCSSNFQIYKSTKLSYFQNWDDLTDFNIG